MKAPVEADKWYLAIDCAGCGEPIWLAETPSPADVPNLKYPTTQVRCPKCEHLALYAGHSVTRRRRLEKLPS